MSKSFCAYPWRAVHAGTDGRMKLCCHIYDESYVRAADGNALVLGHAPIKDIWNGSYYREVRRKMLRGEPVAECTRCYDNEAKGVYSSRQDANRKYFGGTDPLKFCETTSSPPTALELRLGNRCNLKCSGCWSVSSSSHYRERKNALESGAELPDWLRSQWTHEIRSVENFDWDWYKTGNFKSFIAQAAPTLESLYLTGGEPTMIEENLEILQTLKSVGNRKCEVAWTTNLTQWPEPFYEVLPFFDRSEIQMSIEGFGRVQEYIRYPSSWRVIERNFQKALELPAKVRLKLYCVVQAWNVLELADLLAWLRKTDVRRRVDFVPIFLEHPDQINAGVWPHEILMRAIDSLQPYDSGHDSHPIQQIRSYLTGPKMSSDRSAALLRKQAEFIAVNDRLRNVKFADVFPELDALLSAPALSRF